MMATVDLRVEDGKLIVRGPRLGKTKWKYKLEDLFSDVAVGLRLWEGGEVHRNNLSGKGAIQRAFPVFSEPQCSGRMI